MIVVAHGGAGAWPPGEHAAASAAVGAAARLGLEALQAGGTALDAVVAAVAALEDHPRFNAGTGAVPTRDGEVEHDAAVMDGATGRAGAVAVVRDVRNPVLLARAALEDGRHVLLAGAGAEALADAAGIPRAAPGELAAAAGSGRAPRGDTVGAVALDARGRLACATSTGGMRGQAPGRIGDAPIVGAGAWADARCALSATGAGERLLEAAAAHEIAARHRLAGMALQAAADAVVAEIQGDAGIIGLDAAGAVTLASNTAMPRAVATPGGVRAATGRDEPLA